MEGEEVIYDSPSKGLKEWVPRWWTLTLLTLLLFVSFLNRTILALLVKSIKADLAISDQQFAILYGTSFALFFGLVALPIARIVDRGYRKPIVLAGALIWASATVLSGFANSFRQIVLLRTVLAIGEATLAPASASLVADYFPLRSRVAANAFYAAGSQVGNYGSLLIGGMMISALGSASWLGLQGWRLVMVIAALPTFGLAAIFALTMQEPKRDVQILSEHMPLGIGNFFRFLLEKWRLYPCFILGATGPAIVAFAYSAWMPELVSRTFAVDMPTVGVRLGAIGVVSGLGGIFTVPVIASRLIKTIPSAPVIGNLACSVLGGAAAILLPLQHSAVGMYFYYGAIVFLLSAAITGTIGGMQLIVPLRMLGTLNSVGYLTTVVLGLGVGPSAAAGLASLVGGAEALNTALSLLSLMCIVPSIVVLAIAVKPVTGRVAEVAALKGS